MMQKYLKQADGFTLIELVATIVLAGVVMMMISPFFSSGVTDSHRPALRLQDAVALQGTMENMSAAYGKTFKSGTALQTLSNNIGAEGSSFTNQYGTYKVLENTLMRFKNNGSEKDEEHAGTSILKVSICSTSFPGHQLTQLFTVQVPH
jgi:prepilin-type N-terminal cleavage/methylation domain-containing protein